ncbi:MAG: hypothetical protein LKM39_17150 [Chiayiivirga sp.]|jgi:hypothetical protein|nr:hypothetical protein [Chiayiivirga sp.]
MIDALMSGRLTADPKSGTSKNGKQFVTARVMVDIGGEERIGVSLIAFSESACAALLALNTGDSAALAGEFTPTQWTDKEGNTRLGGDLKVHGVLTAYHVRRKRNAIDGEPTGYRRLPGEL